MATVIKFVRGTTAQNQTYTGAEGSLSVDTQKWTLRLHDGTTAGGHELASVKDVSTIIEEKVTEVTTPGSDGAYPEDSELGKALNKKLDKTVGSTQTDLNKLNKEGEFYVKSATSNIPPGTRAPFHVSVRVNDEKIYQTLTTTVDNSNAIYVRVATDHLGTSWEDWNRIGSAGASGLNTVESQETDLNNLKADGEFNCTQATANLPTGLTSPIHLSVRKTMGGALQVAYGKDKTEPKMFIRIMSGSTWSAWVGAGSSAGIDDLTKPDANTDWTSPDLGTEGGSQSNPLVVGLDKRYIQKTEKGQNNGVASLDEHGKIPVAQLPDISITSVKTAANDAGRDALKDQLQEGDVVIVTASEAAGGATASYILDAAKEFKTLGGAGAVTSVAGKTGAVTLAKADVGLDKVENLALAQADTDLAKLTTVTDGSYATPATIKKFMEKCGWVFTEDANTLDLQQIQ